MHRQGDETHNGVTAEFHRLTQAMPDRDEGVRTFLGRAYNLKMIADYGTDPDVTIGRDEAAAVLRSAKSFVGFILRTMRWAVRRVRTIDPVSGPTACPLR